jgi:hypothetical protein
MISQDYLRSWQADGFAITLGSAIGW